MPDKPASRIEENHGVLEALARGGEETERAVLEEEGESEINGKEARGEELGVEGDRVEIDGEGRKEGLRRGSGGRC